MILGEDNLNINYLDVEKIRKAVSICP